MTPVFVKQAAGHLMCSRSTGVAGSGSGRMGAGSRGPQPAVRLSVGDGTQWLIKGVGKMPLTLQRLEHGRELSDC